VDRRFRRAVAVFIAGGFYLALHGVVPCIKGHTYSVAMQHEKTTVGRVVRVSHRSSSHYHQGQWSGILDAIFWAPWEHRSTTEYTYAFSVDGVKMDDSGDVCATPLTPGACDNLGSVLVYYSYEPYSTSRLEDFAVPSRNFYRTGKLVLAIGLPLLVLFCAGMAVLGRKDKGARPNPEDQKGTSKHNNEPDVIHIVPGE